MRNQLDLYISDVVQASSLSLLISARCLLLDWLQVHHLEVSLPPRGASHVCRVVSKKSMYPATHPVMHMTSRSETEPMSAEMPFKLTCAKREA